jgi:hypothetical protein
MRGRDDVALLLPEAHRPVENRHSLRGPAAAERRTSSRSISAWAWTGMKSLSSIYAIASLARFSAASESPRRASTFAFTVRQIVSHCTSIGWDASRASSASASASS